MSKFASPSQFTLSVGVAMKQVQSTDVDSDDEAVHTKARHVLRRLRSGGYNRYFADDVRR